MVYIRTDVGVYPIAYTSGMTVADLVSSLLNTASLEIRGGWAVQETHTGHAMQDTDEIVDGRYYWLTAFIQRQRHRTP